jgi:hypothetical protein
VRTFVRSCVVNSGPECSFSLAGKNSASGSREKERPRGAQRGLSNLSTGILLGGEGGPRRSWCSINAAGRSRFLLAFCPPALDAQRRNLLLVGFGAEFQGFAAEFFGCRCRHQAGSAITEAQNLQTRLYAGCRHETKPPGQRRRGAIVRQRTEPGIGQKESAAQARRNSAAASKNGATYWTPIKLPRRQRSTQGLPLWSRIDRRSRNRSGNGLSGEAIISCPTGGANVFCNSSACPEVIVGRDFQRRAHQRICGALDQSRREDVRGTARCRPPACVGRNCEPLDRFDVTVSAADATSGFCAGR